MANETEATFTAEDIGTKKGAWLQGLTEQQKDEVRAIVREEIAAAQTQTPLTAQADDAWLDDIVSEQAKQDPNWRAKARDGRGNLTSEKEAEPAVAQESPASS